MSNQIPPDGDEQPGGSAWELSEAIKLMGEAQASGDPEQIATAMRRHAEALTNSANTTLIPTLKTVLETVVRKEVGTLTGRIDATVQQQDDRFGYILNQFSAFLEKEDARHDVYDLAEKSTLEALTSVAHRLDEITGYVQQSVTLAREGISIGREALAVGRAAQATGIEALTVARSALGVSESNAKRLGHVEKRFAEVEKAVMALKKGQTASKQQIDKFAADIVDLRKEIAALHEAAKEAARLAKEHARLTEQTAELDRRLLQIEAWKAELEARSNGTQ